ncbi:UNVERIFIED_CONTAM: hypothetical protein FKN15_020322 [Acipenser sinensis]
MGRKSYRKQPRQPQQQQLQHPSCMPGWEKDSPEQELEDDEGWKSFVRSLAAELCPGCGAYGHTLAICPTQYEEEELRPDGGSASVQRPDGGSTSIQRPDGGARASRAQTVGARAASARKAAVSTAVGGRASSKADNFSVL